MSRTPEEAAYDRAVAAYNRIEVKRTLFKIGVGKEYPPLPPFPQPPKKPWLREIADWLCGLGELVLALGFFAAISIGVSTLEFFVIGNLLDYVAVISICAGVLTGIAMIVGGIYRKIAKRSGL